MSSPKPCSLAFPSSLSQISLRPPSPALDVLQLSFKQQWKTVFSVSGPPALSAPGGLTPHAGTTYTFISKRDPYKTNLPSSCLTRGLTPLLTRGNMGLSKPCLDHSHPPGSAAQQGGGKFGSKSSKIKFNCAQVQAVCPVLPPGVTVSGPLGKAHLFFPQTAGSGRTHRRWPSPERMRLPRRVLFPTEEAGRVLEGPQHFPFPMAAPTSPLRLSAPAHLTRSDPGLRFPGQAGAASGPSPGRATATLYLPGHTALQLQQLWPAVIFVRFWVVL